MVRRLLLYAAVTAVLAGADAPADASTIVYRCGATVENLCAINPDGSQQQTLTRDGTADFPYVSPSLSRDGAKLAYAFHSELFVIDTASGARIGPVTRSATLVAVRPDGGRIGAIDLYPSLTGIGLDPIACSFDAAGGDRTCTIRTSTLGWTPDGRLLVDRNSGNANGTQGICAVTRDPDGGYACAPFVAVHPDRNVRDPAVSPDGTTVAATVEEPDSAAGRIVLFDYGSGMPLRDLTAGTQDGSPAWSPDGKAIVFERARSLYVSAATGTPGSERLLTAGSMPTWGGPPEATDGAAGAGAPPPVLAGVRIAAQQRGTSVRATLTVGRGGSTVQAALRAGRTVVGSLTRRRVAAGNLTLTVKLTRAGRARLARAGRLRLTVRLTVLAPGAEPVAISRATTLRR